MTNQLQGCEGGGRNFPGGNTEWLNSAVLQRRLIPPNTSPGLRSIKLGHQVKKNKKRPLKGPPLNQSPEKGQLKVIIFLLLLPVIVRP